MTRDKFNKSQSNNNSQFEYVNKRELMEKIEPLIDNTLMRFGLIPVEVELVKENHRWFLRIFIYSNEREVNIDDCENVSRSLNPFLDELIPVKFYLEVSSPGLDRKLKSDKEYIIFQGKLINLKLKSQIEGTEEKQFICKILDFDPENGLKVLKIDDDKELIVPKEKIHRAQLHIEDI